MLTGRQKRHKSDSNPEFSSVEECIAAACHAYKNALYGLKYGDIDFANESFSEVVNALFTLNIKTEWKEQEFKLCMSALIHKLYLLEDRKDKTKLNIRIQLKEKIKILAKTAVQLHDSSPQINNIMYELSVVHFKLAIAGNMWDEMVTDNDILPVLTPPNLMIIERLLKSAILAINLQQSSEETPVHNTAVIRCFIMLGNAYMRAADLEHALSAFMNAQEWLVRMQEKEVYYLNYLSNIYSKLELFMGQRNVKDIIQFMHRLTLPVPQEISFIDLEKCLLQVDFSRLTPTQSKIWSNAIGVILDRVGDGEFKTKNLRFQQDFTNNSFWKCLENNYYVGRLHEISRKFYLHVESLQYKTDIPETPYQHSPKKLDASHSRWFDSDDEKTTTPRSEKDSFAGKRRVSLNFDC